MGSTSGIEKTNSALYPYIIKYRGERFFESEEKARAWWRRLLDMENE